MNPEQVSGEEVIQDMMEGTEQPPIPPNIASPNDFRYRKYNKATKRLVEGTNDRVDTADPIFATTEVVVPDGNYNWVFREDIQLWQGLTGEQLDKYLASIYVPVPTSDDEWKTAMTTQNVLLMKQMVGLQQTVMALSKQVQQLEASKEVVENA